MEQVTVVGGGIAGLVAAVDCAEAGVPTVLLEARGRLGGRGASSPGPFVTGLGPHAFYAGGSLWDWLTERDLHGPFRRPTVGGFRFRWRGEIRRTPPAAVARAALAVRGAAPVEESWRVWLTERAGPETAEAASGAAGVVTFDHDPGRLSAGFVADRARRILLSVPPPARYVIGGWSAVIDRMAAYAGKVGVRIETGVKVSAVGELDPGPVIVAVSPRAARNLLADATLRVESPRVALLDLGLESRRKDPYIVVDLDGAAFVDRFSAVDRTLAPEGHEVVQASVGMAPEEPLVGAVGRIESVLDAAFDDWRDRTVWRRQYSVSESTGAVDLPGSTWRDRPPIEHPSGVLLAGDWLAAPGHLSEVSCTSARLAATTAIARLREPRRRATP